MKTGQKNKEPKKAMPTKKRETLAERVHRHLNDINSKITDEDIRNVRTEMELRGEGPARQSMKSQENRKRKGAAVEQKSSNKPGDQHITPWDLLNED